MKKIFTACLLLMMLGLAAAYGQSARTRSTETTKKAGARPAASPTPTPPANVPAPVSTAVEDAPGDEPLKVVTDLVSLPVSVMDRRGRYILDLTKDDFQIFEDGKQQEVAFFDTTEKPFTVVLLLDVSRSTRFKIQDIQTAAISFIDQLRPEDKVMVVAFAEQVELLSNFTTDRDQLKRSIYSTRFKDGTSMYDAFKMVTERLGRVEGRKAIVMFTDGVDTTSQRASLSQNLRDADELDAIIFPIEFNTYADVKRMEKNGTVDVPQGGVFELPGGITVERGSDKNDKPRNQPGGTGSAGGDPDDDISAAPGTSRREYEMASKYLADLAERTGGKVEKATTLYDIGSAFSKIAQGLRQQYSIGYYPPDIEKQGTRKIKVKVTRGDVVVKSRETFTIGESKKKAKGRG
jgi:Ca-activated chloride channel homolog